MSSVSVFSLQSIRTDGWFERIGDSVGSFQTLCDVLGDRFFAFSLITGARITALTVDRGNPDETLVDFQVGGAELGVDEQEPQRLSLGQFRQRLASALIAEESMGPPPVRDTDVEAIQLHIGVRYLLLAPLFGYSLEELRREERGSQITVSIDGDQRDYELDDFRQLLIAHVVEELERAEAIGSEPRRGIDLAMIPQAEQAAREGDSLAVIELLGAWAAPLSILLRTPDGQMLGKDTKAELAGALGLLGDALAKTGDIQQGEEVLRLAVQYAVDSPAASVAYARLGDVLMVAKRPAEAIAALRRAANLGAAPEQVWPSLSVAFLERGRLLAALGATLEGDAAGVEDPRLQAVRAQVFKRIPKLVEWAEEVGA